MHKAKILLMALAGVFLFVCLAVIRVRAQSGGTPAGLFPDHRDIGTVLHAGSMDYDARRGDEEREHEERPGKRGSYGREIAERVGKRQGPGSVAHVEGAGTAEAGSALDAVDGIRVIGITVLDELVAGGPVDDEVSCGQRWRD